MIIERFKTLAKRNDKVDWLVDGLMTTGEFTYFVGDSGVGKTYLLIQLLDALQTGGMFLEMAVKQRNCLYVQVDTGRLEWQQQVRDVAAEGLAWTLYATCPNFMDDPEEVEVIRQVVWADYADTLKYPDLKSKLDSLLKGVKFDLVVFDVLNKMTAMDVNGKAGLNHTLDTLAKITKRGESEYQENVHYILVHHPAKSGPKRGINAGSGSGGFANLCGNMLTLYSEDKGLNGLLTVEKTKVTAGRVLEIVRNANGSWSVKKENYEDYKKFLEG